MPDCDELQLLSDRLFSAAFVMQSWEFCAVKVSPGAVRCMACVFPWGGCVPCAGMTRSMPALCTWLCVPPVGCMGLLCVWKDEKHGCVDMGW